jgi:hypothetical protein
MVAVRMSRAFQDSETGDSNVRLPLVGLFSCLYCERHFSTKHELKRHYRRRHLRCIPNYEGAKTALVRSATRAKGAVGRMATRCSDMPSSTSQLIALFILVLIYFGS